MTKKKTRDGLRAFLTKEVAEKNNKSVRSVERYIEGSVDNDEVVAEVFDLKRVVLTVVDVYKKNKLHEALEALIKL